MMQTYRIRVYEDDNYEVMTSRVLLIALDLDTPIGVSRAQVDLEGTRRMIALRRGLDENATERLRLAVHTHPGGAYVMDALG
jgi:hypothetical protein